MFTKRHQHHLLHLDDVLCHQDTKIFIQKMRIMKMMILECEREREGLDVMKVVILPAFFLKENSLLTEHVKGCVISNYYFI